MFTTLRSKILAGFAAIIMINVVFGLWAIYQFSQVGEAMTQATSTNYELTSKIVELVAIVDGQFQLLQQISPGGDNFQTLSQFEQNTADFKLLLNAIPENSSSSREDLIQKIHSGYDRFLERSSAYRLRVAADSVGTKDFLYADVQPAAAALKESCYNLFYQNRVEIHAMRDDLAQELQSALIIVGAVTVLATLFGAIGSFFYSRWAIRPIQRLTQAVKNLTGGRLGERILITTADELGDLSFEFNRMIERLRHYEAMNIEQLLLEKRKVETIVQSIATPIVVVDARMKMLLINNAALTLFRLPLQESYEGREIASLVRDESVVRALRRAADGEEEAGSPSIYMVREEGAERFFAVAAVPLETTSSINGVVAVFSDITHFKDLDRLKSEFLAKVSHEFRTPLTSIMMSIDILREGLLGEINEGQLDLLNSSKDDCRRLSKLITDLLELSRLEGTMEHRTFAQVELGALVDAVLKPHRLPAQEKGVALHVAIEEAVPTVWADPEELRWLLNNLVSNGVRHTESGGSVDIAIGREQTDLVISVKDTGHGIPLDSLGKIFQKFHQVGDSAISTPGSVGLGLAIARDVVEHYGGRIAVVSELHKGSCFTVRIPLERLQTPVVPALMPDGHTSSSDLEVS